MAFTNETVKQSYQGDGSTVTFAIPFHVVDDAETETKVYLRDEGNDPATEQLLTLTTHYTIVGSNVVMVTAPATDEVLVIVRELDLTQILDLVTAGSFQAEAHELNFDRVVAMIQQLEEKISRAPLMQISEQVTGELNYGDPVPETLIGWDDTAENVFLYSFADVTADTDLALANHIADATDAHDASAISVSPTGNLIATDVQAALQELQVNIDTFLPTSALTAGRAVITDGSGLLSVSSVTSTELGYLSGVTSAIQAQINTVSSAIANHISSMTAHTAMAITVTPAGNLASTNVQAALEELQSDIDGFSAGAPTNAQYVVLALNGSLSDERVLTGTANQVILTDGGANGNITLSLPQSIDSAATVTFQQIRLLGTTPELRIYSVSSGSNYNAFRSPALGSNYTYILPNGFPASDKVLQSDSSGNLSWVTMTAGVGAHNLLSATHSDTVAGTPVRGDIIIANSTPAWTKLAIGTNGYVLTSDGTDVSWQPAASSGAPVDASYLTLAVNGTLTNERVLTGTSNQITITDNGAGSTVVLSTPQDIHTAATPTFAGLTLSGFTEGSVLFAGSGGVLSQDNTNFFWDDTGNTLIVGDPGSEGSGINLNGSTYNAVLKVSDITGTSANAAEIILHRHSTTIPPAIVVARSNSNTSSHGTITNGQILFQLIASGWTGSHYDPFGILYFSSDTGTISSTSSPGRFDVLVTPDGSNTSAIGFTVRSDKTIEMPGYTAGFAKFSGSGVISSSTIASTDISDFAEAVDDRVDTLIQDGTGLTWTYNDGANTLTGNVSLSSFSTTDLAEGTNLYYTDERVDDRVAALIQNGTGISWSYNDAGGTLTPTISLASFSTTNLSEGTNLYYTDERVDDRVAALIQNGTGISWVYSDAGGTLTPTVSLAAFSTTNLSEGTNLYYTDERAQDAVGTILTDSSSIDFTYTDGSNQITAAVLPAGVDHDSLLNFVANEHINHTSVSIATSSTSGLSGGGDISTTRNLVVAPDLATAATVASGDIILIADVDDSNNLKRTTAGAIAALGGGGGMSIGGTVTSGTATRVLFVDTGPVLADDAGFTFNKTSNVATLSGGLSGGSANTDNLTIYANDTAYVDNTTGSILIKHRMKFAESFTAVGSGGALNERFIDLTSTVTSSLIINIFTGYTHRPDVLVSVGQILSSAPAFQAAPIFTHTAAGLSDALTYYSGFDSVPRIDTDAASGTSTLGYLYGYNARPAISKTGAATMVAPLVVGFTTFSSPLIGVTDWASGPTVTEYNAFRSYEPVASGCNVTNYYGFKYITPATANKPTITNEFAYASDIASGSAKWNLYFTGTGKSFMQGGLRIGDSSPAQPTEKLEVLGNILIDNGGTTGELRIRENSANGSNYAGFKAASSIASNIVWALPNADGSANQVLKTDGSGNLGWATSSGANHNLLDGSVHPDTVAQTVSRGSLIYGNSTPKWDELTIGSAGSYLYSDGTDVSWKANPIMGSILGGTGTVGGTATTAMAIGGQTTCGMVMPVAGEVFAISIAMNANRTAGTITARYKKNGVSDTTNTAAISTAVSTAYTVFGTPVSFAAGDVLDLETVTASFTPTGNDAVVTLFYRRT